jgi:hypothetical protein
MTWRARQQCLGELRRRISRDQARRRSPRTAKKELKALVPADASKCFGHGIIIKRDKRGALRFAERRRIMGRKSQSSGQPQVPAFGFNEVEKIATAIARGGLFGSKDPYAVLTLCMLAQAEGSIRRSCSATMT